MMSEFKQKVLAWKEKMKATTEVYMIVLIDDNDDDQIRNALFRKNDVLHYSVFETKEEADEECAMLNGMALAPFLEVVSVGVPENCRADSWQGIVENLQAASESPNLNDRPKILLRFLP